jgi:hypothetical protein
MALEATPNLVDAILDSVNAYGEIERECIEAAIMANPYFHSLLPLFESVYTRGAGELWYYDDEGDFILETRNSRGGAKVVSWGYFFFVSRYNRST